MVFDMLLDLKLDLIIVGGAEDQHGSLVAVVPEVVGCGPDRNNAIVVNLEAVRLELVAADDGIERVVLDKVAPDALAKDKPETAVVLVVVAEV